MKEYNISEVANMLDISSESLRKYERRGLIAPLRNENGYRAYTKPDIYILSGLRLLRNAGYSLDEIKKLNKASYEEVLLLKKKRCEELENEIEYRQLVLQALQKEYEELKALESEAHLIKWTNSPAMLRVTNQINDTFMVEDKNIVRWVEHLPIVCVSPSFSKEAVLNGCDEVRFGYAVPLSLAQKLGLSKTPGAEVKPSIKCLTAIVYSEDENYLNARMLKRVLEFCDEKNLEVSGEVWGMTISKHREEGATRRYHRLYIPVSVK